MGGLFSKSAGISRNSEISRRAISYIYNNLEWVEANTKQIATNVDSKTLKVATYNVWFDAFEQDARYNTLLSMLSTLDLDAFCLQEVTQPFIKCLLCQKWVQDNYTLANARGFYENSYGVLVAVNKRIKGGIFFETKLETEMGRSIMSYEFKVNNQSACISTVHLESLNTRETRRKQMMVMSDIHQEFGLSIWMGDLNFDSERNWIKNNDPLEESNLQTLFPNHHDVWRLLKYPNLGKTFDTVTNLMINRQNYEQMRYDRILFKDEKNQWRATDVCLLGDESIGVTDKGRNIFPSDHYGLYCVFESTST
ncbi:tyrosyl-DNA phosphodiesterase [Acrasis kona]|uniref:Tyrosyl-DNA phosphodiesterase n=1 Tax=Acrasis kona TaxID=1008807 RepID=A0AAW2YX41_9EUKA